MDRSFAFANFSESAARPIFREQDAEVQDGAFENVIERLEYLQEQYEEDIKCGCAKATPYKITGSEVRELVKVAKKGKTLAEPKKKLKEPEIFRVPLSSVIQWLEENVKEFVNGPVLTNALCVALENEMKLRHAGR